MKNSQNRTVWIIIIVIVLLAIIGFGYKSMVMDKPGTPAPGTPGTSTPATNTPPRDQQLVTYENKEYGYKVSFPGTMGAAKGPNSLIIQPSYPVASTSISDATIEVTSIVGKCATRTDVQQSSVKSQKIGDATFTVSKGTATVAGATSAFTEYKTEKNTVCYKATLTINSKTSSNAKITETTNSTIADLGVQFASLMSTFTIGSITAPKTPVISSITPAQGPVGTVVTIQGYNLAGAEGALDAWILNGQEELGYLEHFGKSAYPDTTKITIKIPAKACTTNNIASGKPCEKFINITPGQYSIFTKPFGKSSNIVSFTVTK